MKVKIKFTEGGNVIVSVPYKNGYVDWISHWSSFTFRWAIDNCPDLYRPSRVEACHMPFLVGKTLQRRIIQSAAAHHEWYLMDKYKKAFECMNRRREVGGANE